LSKSGKKIPGKNNKLVQISTRYIRKICACYKFVHEIGFCTLKNLIAPKMRKKIMSKK
jgi:hypothetical protein